MTSFTPAPDEPSHEEQPETQEPRLITRRDPLARPYSEHPRPTLFGGLARLRRKRPAAGLPQFSNRLQRLPLRKILLTAGTVAAVFAFALIATALWLRHAMHASLPQLDGTLHTPGLSGPVTITRDAEDVPDIHASSLDDLLFAQGFVTAQDRLWQMDMLRRHAAGELAEVLGPGLVEHDRLQRTLQIREAADRALAALPPDQLHQLKAYARGVNAFLAQDTSLPVEFHLLHYRPAPWTPRDCLLVYLAMFQDLSTKFPVKLRREALAAHLPPALLADLYPVGSWRDHPPTQPAPDLTTPVPEVEQIPLDRSQSRLQAPQLANPGDIVRLANQFPSLQCTECRAGSNNWAIAGARSATGAPLVSNDMHLTLNVPDIWYEAGLHAPASATAPALDVTGFTLPGVPFVVVGRNQHVAWSFTNLGADVQDVRIEHLRGTGAGMQYQSSDGSWQPVVHHTEHIVVRGGRDVELDVLMTAERIGLPTMAARAAGVTEIPTPILSALMPSEHRALSLAWTIYDPTNVSLPLFGLDSAADGASMVSALASFGGPSLNLIYADDHNHIGYHAIGAIPIRGPAIQHPRAVAASVPTGAAPADEEDELSEADGIQPADQAAPETEATPDAQAATQPSPTPAPADRPASDYSIGSPISPVPVDALDASQIWSGYIPYGELPSVVDPADGVLATANARVTSDNYPYAIALNWEPPYRVERIYKLLAGRTNLTPADMLAIQNDVHSEFDLVVAQRLAYALDHASKPALAGDTKRLRQAADILRTWTGDVSANAAAPAIVEATRAELWPILLRAQIIAHDSRRKIHSHANQILGLYDWAEESVALESLLQHTPARWLPAGFANWDDLLAVAVEHGLRDSHAPGNLSAWHYGPLHPVEIDHPVFDNLRLSRMLLGVPSGTGPRSSGGDGTTIKAIALHHGPSERFTADLSNPQNTFGNITTGESGDPASPYYLDQFLPWLNGTTFAMPLAPTQQNHTLTLLP